MGLFAGTRFDLPPRCDRCEALVAECVCPPEPKVWTPADKQTAKLSLEKRKRGKSVTVVSGLSPADCDLPALLAQLKTACGAGGTLKDDTLEIQGEHRERIRTVLAAIGYRVKG